MCAEVKQGMNEMLMGFRALDAALFVGRISDPVRRSSTSEGGSVIRRSVYAADYAFRLLSLKQQYTGPANPPYEVRVFSS
jgi:hypothetical protein